MISFDCYGTLVDWESGIIRDVGNVLKKHGIAVCREKILSLYADVEKEFEKVYRPYREVLRFTNEEILKKFGIDPTDEEKEALVNGIATWQVFEDTKDALERIKEISKIAIISNVDNDIMEITIKNIGVKFDFVVTAQMVKAYKPSILVFKRAWEIFNVRKEDWIHVGQSMFHNI